VRLWNKKKELNLRTLLDLAELGQPIIAEQERRTGARPGIFGQVGSFISNVGCGIQGAGSGAKSVGLEFK